MLLFLVCACYMCVTESGRGSFEASSEIEYSHAQHPAFHSLLPPSFPSSPLLESSISFSSLASKGFPNRYSKSVCVRLHSENSEPTMLFSRTTPDGHPPMPPPCRWPALITLPTLAKFELVWRRRCDVALFPSCLVEHIFTAGCVLLEYQTGRKYSVHSYIL